jgi:hypothetical protein
MANLHALGYSKAVHFGLPFVILAALANPQPQKSPGQSGRAFSFSDINNFYGIVMA